MISYETTLRIARQACGIKLLEAAAHIGVPETLMSRFERLEATITSRQIERLAALYDCDPDALHGRKPLRIAARPPSLRG